MFAREFAPLWNRAAHRLPNKFNIAKAGGSCQQIIVWTHKYLRFAWVILIQFVQYCGLQNRFPCVTVISQRRDPLSCFSFTVRSSCTARYADNVKAVSFTWWTWIIQKKAEHMQQESADADAPNRGRFHFRMWKSKFWRYFGRWLESEEKEIRKRKRQKAHTTSWAVGQLRKGRPIRRKRG